MATEYWLWGGTAAVTVIGWIVVDIRASRHATRNEIYSEIEGVRDRVERVVSHAREFFTVPASDDRSPTFHRGLVNLFSQLESRVGSLANRNSRLDQSDRLIKLKQLCTGGTAEDKDRQAIDLNHDLLRRIEREAQSLNVVIQEAYEDMTRPWWRRRR